MEDVKPRYHRKPRKDGTARKARVFGKPWWYEKAGWTEDRWNERRSALLDRLREKWPDWLSFENDAPAEDDIKRWVRSVVASFDDASWCLPDASDPLERLEQQLSVYSAWARFIMREASRFQMSRNLPDQDTASESLQLANTTVARPEHKLARRSTESANMNGTEPHDVQGKMPHQWRQTRPSQPWTNQEFLWSDTASQRKSLPAKRKASKTETFKDGTARQASHQSIDTTGLRSTILSPKGNRRVFSDTSEEGTEITEVSDSEPLRHSATMVEVPIDKSIDRETSHKRGNKWRDNFWDDVVVMIDATSLNGEYFPIPMTMLKPGSSRASCRWDDFELDDLYARFKVESGLEIDLNKFALVCLVNKKTVMIINTPGRYKLMLKEFAEKVHYSSSMVLHLRVVKRASLTRPPTRALNQQSHFQDQETIGGKRSQFTGAASDFSSDSESEQAQPFSKRQKPDTAYEQMASRSDSNAGSQHSLPESLIVGQAPEIPPPQVRSDVLKGGGFPEKSTQDGI